MGLMYSEGLELEPAICRAVMGGEDTDCNGATVGSIVGAVRGAKALPAKWIGPLNDRLESIVVGMTDNRISDLAARTVKVGIYGNR
jgi:ADP-ribosylglycohydrolase